MRTVILIFLLLFQYNFSHGCDCNTIVGMKEAKSVFIGRVIDVKRIDTSYIRYEIQFKVSKFIKGNVKAQIIKINTPSLNVAGCGISFSINDEYIVYTYLHNNLLYTGDCTRTRKLK